MRAELIQISDYQLTVEIHEFNEAAEALVNRAEEDGLVALLRYGFYADEETGTAGAVIVFRDATAWAEHHEMVAQWDEYDRFREVVKLTRIQFIGDLPPELAEGIRQAGIEYDHLGSLQAGFVR